MLTIYRASAGSGKTFALAYEYIKILLGVKLADGRYVLNGGERPLRDRHRALLAITFTKAATAEMKSRIISALDKLANIADTPQPREIPYAEMLRTLYGCTRPALREAAARSLLDLLNDYGRFHVSTIDSFFQSVLRTFAREIDHQGDYDLALDRLDIIRQSVGMMLDNLNVESPADTDRVYRWLRQQVDEKVDEGQSYNVFDRNGQILRKLTSKMDKALNETFTERADEVRAYMADEKRVGAFRAYLSEQVKLLQSEIVRKASRARKVLIEKDLWDKTGKPFVTRLNKFSDSPKDIDPGGDYKTVPLKALLADFSAGVDLGAVFKKDVLRKISEADTAELQAAIDDAFITAWVNTSRMKVFENMKKALVDLEFITLVQFSVDDFLRENNTMLIADTGELLAKIISDAEMPFIYERMGIELESLLIDEFQDTSRLQWKNLKPLVSNSLGEAHDSLIIGDVKQAIYRFRNSDPTLLGRTVSERDFPAPMHRMRGDEPDENTNHRSSHEVVRFNNTLFSNLAANLGVEGYSNVVQELESDLKDTPGYVKFVVSAGSGNRASEKSEDYKHRIFDGVADEIRRQHAAGYKWRDIMILVRRNSDAADAVSYFLSRYPDIRILSNEALLLNNSQAVRAVISMLEMAERVRTDTAEDHPYGTRESIAEFNNRCHIYMDGGEKACEAVLHSLADVQGTPGRSETVEAVRRRNPANVVVFLESIIAEFPQEYRDAHQAYLSALLDKAVEHCQGSNPSVSAFVERYHRNSSKWAIQGASDLDAVRVMTIHSSKGLESPCVHLPLVDWCLQEKETVWLPLDGFADLAPEFRPPMLRLDVLAGDAIANPAVMPEFQRYVEVVGREARADTLNMTYVAFTRARRELIVHSAGEKIGLDLKTALLCGRRYTSDPRLIDLTDCIEEVDGTFTVTVGAPTAPKKPDREEEQNDKRLQVTDKAASFEIYHRRDSRELISIDDVFSEDIGEGEEDLRDIVDRPDGSPESLAAAARGNALHAILGMMRTVDDLDSAVDRYRDLGRASAVEAEQYRADLRGAFENAPAEVRSWFAPGCEVYSERSIYEPATGRTYRPDRVVKLPSGRVAVIDYKFTTRPQERHKGQIQNYVSLIEQLEPATATAHLWYPLLNINLTAGEN